MINKSLPYHQGTRFKTELFPENSHIDIQKENVNIEILLNVTY